MGDCIVSARLHGDRRRQSAFDFSPDVLSIRRRLAEVFRALDSLGHGY
jgi:hypothetical protein